VVPGGQGVRREAESQGHAEKNRAVIEGRHPAKIDSMIAVPVTPVMSLMT
jgi:hypothetical protein